MISALLSSVLDMGLSKTTIYEIASNYKSDPNYIKKLMQTFSFIYWFVYIFVIILYIFFLHKIVNSWIKLTTMDHRLAYKVLMILGITSLLSIPKTFISSIFIGFQRMEFNNLIDVCTAICQQLGVIFLLVSGKNIIFIAYWLGFINVLRILIYIFFVSKLVSITSIFPIFFIDIIKRIKGYSLKMMLSSMILVIHKQIDKIMISKLLPIGVLGIYSFAYNSIGKSTLVSEAISKAVFPEFANLSSKKFSKKLTKLFFTLQDCLIFLTPPIFVFVIYFSDLIFKLILNSHEAKILQLPIILLCISFYLNVTLRLLRTYSFATNKPNYIIKSDTIALFLITPITILLIIYKGIIGASFSWILFYLVGSLVIVPKVYSIEFSRSGLKWFKSVITSIILSLLVYIPGWFIFYSYFRNNYIIGLLCYLIASIIYTTIAFNFMSCESKKFIVTYIPYIK